MHKGIIKNDFEKNPFRYKTKCLVFCHKWASQGPGVEEQHCSRTLFVIFKKSLFVVRRSLAMTLHSYKRLCMMGREFSNTTI